MTEYPFDPSGDNQDKIYLMFHLNQKGIEKELRKYTWDPRDIMRLKQTRFGKFGVMGLTQLMKVAKSV